MGFPVSGVIDAFNRADENPLSDGGKWSQGPQFFGANDLLRVVSNQVQDTGVSFSSNAYRNDQNYGPNVEVYCTIVTDAVLRLYARLADIAAATTNGYMLVHNGTAMTLYRLSNSVQTQIASGSNATPASGDKIGLEIIGAVLTGYYKSGAGAWTSIVSVTDGTYDRAGKVGMYIGAHASPMDDFGGGSLPDTSLFPQANVPARMPARVG